MADSDQERTEDATDFRREEYRRKGQVAQTRELATVFSLLMGACLVWMLGKSFIDVSTRLINLGLSDLILKVRTGFPVQEALGMFFFEGAKIIFPVMILFMVMGVMSSVIQVGILNNEEVFDFDLERLNPIAGTKKIFSLRSLIEGFKSVVKVSLIGMVLYSVIRADIKVIPFMSDADIHTILFYAGKTVVKLLFASGMCMAVLAASDYFFQRWELEKQMKMTKQEIKEEAKSREGDPLIKSRLRRQQREMANKRMMDAVPKADVIITNPTHIAIAIMYDPLKHAAPQIVAKGADLVAERIRNLAREHNIPIVENKPLARTMYKTLKIGQTIPRELFNAVAQVLSYVYRLKKKKFKKTT